MNTVKVVFPVVFMIGLGAFARRARILSEEQNSGIKKLIFTILLPILVFNAAFTMSVDARYLKIMLFMFILQCVSLALGSILFRLIKTPYSHISPYMMTTIEGGNAFYPLYISLMGVGYTSYFVLLDVPGIFMIFLVLPLLLAKGQSSKVGTAQMLRSVYTNPVVCALIAGLLLNVTGAARAILVLPGADVYHETAAIATAPIAPLILFTLGYSFKIGRENLRPLLGTLVVRLLLMGGGLAAALAIFPWILQDHALLVAVVLFLMCPPAFALPIIIENKYTKPQDETYCSTYISLHMLVSVFAFVLIALFMGA